MCMNPCINCQQNPETRFVSRGALAENCHDYYKITLPSGKQIMVCSEHLKRTDIFRVRKIENSSFVLYGRGVKI